MGLLDLWQNNDTKEMENNINQWICEYHNLDLFSHNEKTESEMNLSSNMKKRKAIDDSALEPLSSTEQVTKKRKVIPSGGNISTLDRFFAVSKKTIPTQPLKAKYECVIYYLSN